jgi:hypothetical protein
MFLCLISLSNSSFVLILHVPSLSFVRQKPQTSHNALFVQGVSILVQSISYRGKPSRVSRNYGRILSTRFFPIFVCFTRHQPVTQQDCTRNTCVCSVYNMTHLLFESDSRRGYSGCHNLPPSANKANESSWTQHYSPGNSEVFGR